VISVVDDEGYGGDAWNKLFAERGSGALKVELELLAMALDHAGGRMALHGVDHDSEVTGMPEPGLCLVDLGGSGEGGHEGSPAGPQYPVGAICSPETP